MSSDSNNDSSRFDPYRVWLGIPKAEQPPNHYRLLGVSLFESDPDVIQEGADRQVAHLKTKQTGARVAHSQKLLQEVVSAVGCLLDERAKAKYDQKLRESLKPPAPAESVPPAPREEKPQPAPGPQPIAPQPIAPQPLPQFPPAPQFIAASPQPVYQQPAYIPPQPIPPQPIQPQPMRPIPVPAPEPQTAEAPDHGLPAMSKSFHAVSVHGGRAKNSGGDMVKLAVAGGVALLLLVVAWSVLSQPGMLGGNPPSKSAVAKATTKPKPAAKPATATHAPKHSEPPKTSTTAETATSTEATPGKVESDLPATPQPAPPSTPPEPTPAPSPPPQPAPMPMPATPTPAPMPTPPTNPLASASSSAPSIPAPAKPAAKTLWRHSGGYIEQQADGSWKELSPTGDYFTLTAVGTTGDVLEFDRPGSGRLRLFDNRYEQATGLGTFAEVAKGNWCQPADEIEMDSPQLAMLQRACQLYADNVAKARRQLLRQFDEATSSNRKRIGKADERLAVITVLEAEKARFETEGLVPWSLPMQADTAKYLADVQQARGPADALFQKVIAHFVARKDDQSASSVEALKHKALAPLVIAKFTKTDVPRPPPPFGFNPNRRRDNELPDDDGTFTDDPRTGLIRLWSNGAVNNANGKSAWTIAMGTLQLQFVRPKYSIVDTIAIGERGDELSGKSVFSNKFTLSFTGKFENMLEPHEHRPVIKFSPKLKAETGAAEATE